MIICLIAQALIIVYMVELMQRTMAILTKKSKVYETGGNWNNVSINNMIRSIFRSWT